MKTIFALLLFLTFTTQVSSRTLDEIKASGYVLIGSTNGDTRPVHYIKDGGKVGIEIDMMRLIAGELGVNLRRTYVSNLGARVSDLVDGKVDLVVSSFSVTESRLKKIDFSLPYLITGVGVLMDKKFEGQVATFQDLRNHKIALLKNSTAHSLFKEYFPDVPTLVVTGTKGGMDSLDRGLVSGYANDLLFLDASVKQEPNKYYTLEGTLSADPYGIGVQKDNPELLNAVNNAVRKIKSNGQLQRIIDKYINSKTKKDSTLSSSVKIEEIKYTIKRGDTLSKIASVLLGDITKWREIYEANQDVIVYPNQIRPGQKIIIKKLVKIARKAPAKATTTNRSTPRINSPVRNSFNTQSIKGKLRLLKELYDEGLINENSYNTRQEKILDQLYN